MLENIVERDVSGLCEAVGKVRALDYESLEKLDRVEAGGKLWADWYIMGVRAVLADDKSKLDDAVRNMMEIHRRVA